MGAQFTKLPKKKVLDWPLIDVDSNSLLSVKKSLCTIFSGTPCTSMKYYPQDSPSPAGPIDTFMNDDNPMKYLVDHFLYIFT